jgi:hypothetical protein
VLTQGECLKRGVQKDGFVLHAARFRARSLPANISKIAGAVRIATSGHIPPEGGSKPSNQEMVMARKSRRFKASRFEPLETRRLFCLAHMPQIPGLEGLTSAAGKSGATIDFDGSHIRELRPDLVGVKNPPGRAGPAADIVWVNRGNGSSDTDGFNAVFGAGANTARAVVDAVITAYERMIGSFNYADNSANYDVTLSMGGAGIGASAGINTALGGKPKSGTISMDSGLDGHGLLWFIDPTPFDDSEFTGNIVNAFAADAQNGSPAANLADFYTVVASEMTHCMGQFGNALAGWANLTTNTGLHDNATGVGNLWVFRGPSIKHLMTSDNAGQQDLGAAVHTSESGNNNVNFGGDNYWGAEDQGNALFEMSRRYLVDYTSALMFKDAYAYSSTNPAQWGTFYSNLNQTTKVLTVRGGDFATGMANSSDTITISRSGNTVTVSVDAGNDVPGTGALPGAGSLPAWVSQYDISQISSITVDAGDGDDAVNVSAQLGLPVTVQGGAGADVVNFNEPAVGQQMVANSGGFNSGTTNVTIAGGIEAGIMTGNGNASQMLVLATAPARPLLIFGGSGNETITISSATAANYPAPLQVINGGGGNDILEVNDSFLIGNTSVYTITGSSVAKNNGFAGLNYSDVDRVLMIGETGPNAFNVSGGSTPIWLDGGVTPDTYNILDSSASAPPRVVNATGSDVLNVNTDGGAGNVYAETAAGQSYAAINIAPLSRLDVVAGANSFVKTTSLAVNFPGHLNLNDNDLILDYSGASQLAAIQNLINQARAGGAWNGSFGITSFAARENVQHSTTLGAMEATDYKSIYGAGATFDGQAIDNTAVLVKYTWYGDTDFNGKVNFDDYVRTDGGFNNHRTGWINGDSDGNGQINFDDYVLIDLAFNTQTGTL